MRRLIPLAMLALLAGCAGLSPEARVKQRLIAAGLEPPMAACMAERLVRHLSTDQLRTLGHAVKLGNKEKVGKLKVGELIKRISSIGDPHIVKVVARDGIGCALAG
jgi:hypothetical protein